MIVILLKQMNLVIMKDANLLWSRLDILDKVFITDQVPHRRLALRRVDRDSRRTSWRSFILLRRIAEKIQILIVTLFVRAFAIISADYERVLGKHALVAHLVLVLRQNDCLICILARSDGSVHLRLVDLVLDLKFLGCLSPDLLSHILCTVRTRMLVKIEQRTSISYRLVITLTFRKSS